MASLAGIERPWHSLPYDEVMQLLSVNESVGVPEPVAKQRLLADGPNSLTPPPARTVLKIAWENFNHLFSYILIACGALAGVFEDWAEVALIFIVVVVDVVLGVIQEGRAEKATLAISKMTQTTAVVIRDGHQRSIPSQDVVVGDILQVTAGDRVPADVRWVKTANLQVMEAVLTGESIPVTKSTVPVPASAGLAEQACMGFCGTLVSAGQGTGCVIATGDRAAIGKIHTLMKQTAVERTPLTLQIDQFTRGLAVLCLLLAIAVFFIAWAGRDFAVRQALKISISIAVALIPEGLGVVVTIALSAGVSSMVKQHVIVRQLPAVETLGSVSIICSDKTGTLTRNEMTAVMIRQPKVNLRVTGVGYHPDGDVKKSSEEGDVVVSRDEAAVLRQLLLPAVLCNDSSLLPQDSNALLESSLERLPMTLPFNMLRAESGDFSKAVDSQMVSPILAGPRRNTGEVRIQFSRSQSSGVAHSRHVVEGHSFSPAAWEWTGDPTEVALLALGMKSGLNLRTIRALNAACPRLDTTPFTSELKFMSTLHDIAVPAYLLQPVASQPDASAAVASDAATLTPLPAGGGGVDTDAVVHKRVAFVKGSPEVLFERCVGEATGLNPWLPAPFDPEPWRALQTGMAREGLRVLALCHMDLPPTTVDISSEHVLGGEPSLVLHCLVGIVDPPRPDAIDAIQVCHSAGVEVCMITGDNADTARTIAGWMGIANDVVVTGAMLQRMSEEELVEAVKDCRVFARTTPEHKLRIVKAMQSRGACVSMTGDGVNDAPALKAASVGVAMGITGTEVAKEAAKLILTDDSFASIAAAIRVGRGVYSNIVKQLCFLLPTNVAQGLSIGIAIAAGIETPLTAVQVLWINLITSATLGLVIGVEKAEPDVMFAKPRRPGKWLVGKRVVWRTLFVGAIMIAAVLGNSQWTLKAGGTADQAHTVAMNTLVISQALYCLSCRFMSRSSVSVSALTGNPWLTAMVVLNGGLQALLTYTPGLHGVFDTAYISGLAWLRIVGLAFAVFVLIELEKSYGPKYLGPFVTPFVKWLTRKLHCA